MDLMYLKNIQYLKLPDNHNIDDTGLMYLKNIKHLNLNCNRNNTYNNIYYRIHYICLCLKLFKSFVIYIFNYYKKNIIYLLIINK